MPVVIRASLSFNWGFQQLEQVEKSYQIHCENLLMNVLFFGSLSEHRNQVRIEHGDTELKKVSSSADSCDGR